jgi:hypothetical protein
MQWSYDFFVEVRNVERQNVENSNCIFEKVESLLNLTNQYYLADAFGWHLILLNKFEILSFDISDSGIRS